MYNLTALRFRVGFNPSNRCTLARNLSELQTKRNREGPDFGTAHSILRPAQGTAPCNPVLPLAPPPAALSLRGGARGVYSCSNARRSGSDVTLAHRSSLRLCRQAFPSLPSLSSRSGARTSAAPIPAFERLAAVRSLHPSHGRSRRAGSCWTFSPSQPPLASADHWPRPRLERPRWVPSSPAPLFWKQPAPRGPTGDHFRSPPPGPFYPSFSFPSSSLVISVLPGFFAFPSSLEGQVGTVGKWAGPDDSVYLRSSVSLPWTPENLSTFCFLGRQPLSLRLTGKLRSPLLIFLCCHDCLMSSWLPVVMAACCYGWQLAQHRQSVSHT